MYFPSKDSTNFSVPHTYQKKKNISVLTNRPIFNSKRKRQTHIQNKQTLSFCLQFAKKNVLL